MRAETIEPVRLAVVLSHPTQYYSPWFRWVTRHSGIVLRVFYLWDFGIAKTRDPHFETTFQWDVDLLSGYDSEFLRNASRNPGAEHFFGFNNPELTARLSAWRPDALLVFGYNWASHLRAIAWGRLHRIPLIFRGDSHLLGRGAFPLHSRFLLRALFSQFASFLFVGAANREYFKAFGVPDKKLFFAPHSVDGSLYSRRDPRHAAEAASLRLQLGLKPSTKVVLFAGKFVSPKQPLELLKAFLELNFPESALVYVGDGPERDQMESLANSAAAKSISAQVRFLPFANQSEMPSRYLMAELFVLPSKGVYETWGLAVNEAMNMGVPCMVSQRVGCQRDLVIPGETGWVFDSGSAQSLKQTLSEALEQLGSESKRQALQQAVARKMEGYTYRETTNGLLAALAAMRGRYLLAATV